jgi:hypothetical protein
MARPGESHQDDQEIVALRKADGARNGLVGAGQVIRGSNKGSLLTGYFGRGSWTSPPRRACRTSTPARPEAFIRECGPTARCEVAWVGHYTRGTSPRAQTGVETGVATHTARKNKRPNLFRRLF